MGDTKAQVTIRRTAGYADGLRRYRILVDGDPRAELRAHESVTIPLEPGTHTLLASLDWCGCEPVRLEAAAGRHYVFECGNNLVGWRLLFAIVYVLFLPRRYLYLRPANAA